jgi:hypothetical protein
MSNQLSPDEIKKRSELLKKARQILVQEYTTMRSHQHQQWIKNSENSWRTNGVLIAYPTARLYPTEQEIINKALELYNSSTQPAVPLPNPPATTVQDIQPEQPMDAKSVFDAEPVSITEQLQAAYNQPTETSIIDTGGVTEMPPSVPTITKVVQAGGDFVIVHEPIMLNNTALPAEPEVKEPEPEVKEEPKVEEPELEVKEEPTVKHSLLRSVLSGWLAKNKDKDKT